MMLLMFAPVKVPEKVVPFFRIRVSLQAGMAMAVVKRHASRARFSLILEFVFITQFSP